MKRWIIGAAALLLLLGYTPVTRADCQFECKAYADGDKFCWEWLSGRPKASMVNCREVAFCYPGADGTTWCVIKCEGTRCYLA